MTQTGRSDQAGDPEQQLARGRGTGLAPDKGQPGAPTRQAGRASGQQIDLGGQTQSGGNGSGDQFVRIEPLDAAPAPAQPGTTASGSGVVQGYVPRDDSTMSAADQSLIRAYFTQGSGS
jgi:hypothetical protein